MTTHRHSTDHHIAPVGARDLNDPIPEPTTAMLPFSDAAELRQRWRALMGELGFSESLIWVGLVSDHRLVPPLPQLEIPDHVAMADVADVYVQRCGELVSAMPATAFTLLLSRPGCDGVTAQDQTWANLLTEAARRHQAPLLAVHRANDQDLVTLAAGRLGTAAA